MRSGTRRRHSPEFKAEVALEAFGGRKSNREIARQYQLQPAQIAQWKRQLREHAAAAFASGRRPDRGCGARMHGQIRQLHIELDWLRSKLQLPNNWLRDLVDPCHPALSISRQCALLGLPRRSYYYRPVAPPPDQLALMAAISKQYLVSPQHGSRRITAALRQQGWRVNRKRVQRLSRVMVTGSPTSDRRKSRGQPIRSMYSYALHQGRPKLVQDARQRKPGRFRPRVGSRAALG